MNMIIQQPVSFSHRARVLRAMGLTPWVRRTLPFTPAIEEGLEVSLIAATGDCVVVIPEGCSVRELDLLGRALSACGAPLARAARLTVSGGQLAADVPQARAYLVFGEAQAHALGRSLPATVMHRAQIVLADEPARVLTSADAKRRLWSALRSVRRALATAGD
ncbi:MAG: hypothetical protein OQK79_10015 [Rhodanobacter sp.]|jgi:hypothetical protein|nr:hypothetical protein [Rhodanobacter sp.]